jgi:hypothetical protein
MLNDFAGVFKYKFQNCLDNVRLLQNFARY